MNNKAEPGLRLPASVSALGRASHPAGRGPSLSSLFLPLAAVASAAEIEKDRHTNVYRHIPRPNRSGSHQLLTFLKIGTRALKKAPLGLSLRHFVPPCCSNPAAEIEKDRHTNVYRSFSVGAAGFEPTASSSRTRRATNCAMPRKYRNPMGCGLVGDERIELPQVESESTALPLCKSPLFGFVLSTEAPLTKNIIQPPPPFVNHFFDFSVHVFSAFSTTAFSRLFSSPALDTRSLWEYSYSIIYLPLLRENGRNEGCSI